MLQEFIETKMGAIEPIDVELYRIEEMEYEV
jgi:hypothetical protein